MSFGGLQDFGFSDRIDELPNYQQPGVKTKRQSKRPVNWERNSQHRQGSDQISNPVVVNRRDEGRINTPTSKGNYETSDGEKLDGILEWNREYGNNLRYLSGNVNKISETLTGFVNEQADFNYNLEQRVISIIHNEKVISRDVRENFVTVIGKITELDIHSKRVGNIIKWLLIILCIILAIVLVVLLVWLIIKAFRPEDKDKNEKN